MIDAWIASLKQEIAVLSGLRRACLHDKGQRWPLNAWCSVSALQTEPGVVENFAHSHYLSSQIYNRAGKSNLGIELVNRTCESSRWIKLVNRAYYCRIKLVNRASESSWLLSNQTCELSRLQSSRLQSSWWIELVNRHSLVPRPSPPHAKLLFDD